MNNINIGYRIKIDNFISEKNKFSIFIENFKKIYNCSEIKVTTNMLESINLDSIITDYVGTDCYTRNFHIDKNFIYNYNQNMKEDKLFSFLNGFKSHLITHLNDGEIDNDLYQKLKDISSVMPKQCILLLENPDSFVDLFKYMSACNELVRRMKEDKITNIGFCLDFGHILKYLSTNGITFDSYYEHLLKQNDYIERIKEFHLHDYISGKDHQVFDNINDNLKNFKKIYSLRDSNPIILENNVSNDIADKQIELIKGMLLDGNKKD